MMVARSSRFSLDRLQFAFGALALVFALVTVGFLYLNGGLQRTAAEGQAKIASAQAAANVNNTLIRLLAKSATENNDPALKALLAENGITVSERSTPAAAPTPAAPVN